MFIRIQVPSPVSLGSNVFFFFFGTRYIFCVSWRRNNYRFTYDFLPFYQTFGNRKWPKFRSFALPENFQNWLLSIAYVTQSSSSIWSPHYKSFLTFFLKKIHDKHRWLYIQSTFAPYLYMLYHVQYLYISIQSTFAPYLRRIQNRPSTIF